MSLIPHIPLYHGIVCLYMFIHVRICPYIYIYTKYCTTCLKRFNMDGTPMALPLMVSRIPKLRFVARYGGWAAKGLRATCSLTRFRDGTFHSSCLFPARHGGTPSSLDGSWPVHLKMDDDWGYPCFRKPPNVVGKSSQILNIFEEHLGYVERPTGWR